MTANLNHKIEAVAWEKHHAKIYPFTDDFVYVDKKFKYGYRCYVGEYQGWGICDWRIVRVTNTELKRALAKV